MPTRSRINSTAIGRRPFLAGLAVTTAAASTAAIANSGVVGSGLRLLETPAPGPVDVHLANQAISDAVSVLVDDAAIATRGLIEALHPNRGLVKELRHDREFSMFAMTWREAPNVTAFFRAERPDGTWSEWFAADSLDSPVGEEGNGLKGTEPVYVGRTTAVQVSTIGLNVFNESLEDLISLVQRAGAGDFSGLAELVGPVSLHDAQGVFIDGGVTPEGIEPIAEESDVTGMPRVITRAGWGADESVRGGTVYDSEFRGTCVHHTAGANNYSQAEAAGVVRGIYKYHTVSRGWTDIGYNALVDKYGNIYEGRYGGLTKNVQGAHAGGFNTGTFGISMMGDYSTVHPTTAMINSVGAMVGWRHKVAGVKPIGKTTFTAGGHSTSKWSRGQQAQLNTIFAHREVAHTTCPGNAGYAQMDRIRTIAQQKFDGLGSGIISNERPDGGTDIRADLPNRDAIGDAIGGGDLGSIIDGLELPPEAIAAIPGLQAMAQGEQQVDTFSGGRSILAASLGLAGAPGLGNDAESVLGAVGRNADQGPSLADIPVLVQPTTTKDGDDEFATEWRAVTEAWGDVLGQPVTGVQQGATVPNETGEADPVRYVKFERGVIVTSLATGTHAIWEEIAEAWAKQGFEIGRLGAPTTTQAPNWGADRADFQGGSVTRDGVTRAVDVAYA